MAGYITLIDGFEHYGPAGSEARLTEGGLFWTSRSGGALSTAYARTGTHSYRLGPTDHLIKEWEDDASTVCVSTGINILDLPQFNGGFVLHQFRNVEGKALLNIQITPQGFPQVIAGGLDGVGAGPGDIIATGVQIITPNQFPLVESRVYFHDTNGSVEIKVDDVSVLRVAGIDTIRASSGSNYCRGVAIGTIDTAEPITFGGDYVYLDDVTVQEAVGNISNITFIGKSFGVEYWSPIADGADADFALSSGTETWPLVDDGTPDEDATYIESTTLGDKSDVTFANRYPIVRAIKALMPVMRIRQLANDGSEVTLRTVDGATITDVAASSPSMTYMYAGAVSQTDAATDNWSPQSVPGLQLELTAGWSGALVYASAGLSAPNSSTTVISFNTEAYDIGGWHDGVSPSRLTVPYAALVRVTAQSGITGDALSDSAALTAIIKNGGSFVGAGRNSCQTIASTPFNCMSAIVSADAGDYFELNITPSLGSEVTTASNFIAVETLPASIKYAVVNKSANQTLPADTITVLTWDQEVADVGGFHDNAVNNSRLTVPAGVSLVRLSAGVVSQAQVGRLYVDFIKNGASAVGLVSKSTDDDTGDDNLSVMSAIVEVVPGDYFECRALTTNSVDVISDDAVWFCIEEVPERKRALVTKAGSQSASGPSSVTWTAETYDTGGFFNIASPTKFTIPAGVRKVRTGYSLPSINTGGQLICVIIKNGATVVGGGNAHSQTASTENVAAMSAIVEVQEGDYFECQVTATGGNIVGADDVWFFIEEIP